MHHVIQPKLSGDNPQGCLTSEKSGNNFCGMNESIGSRLKEARKEARLSQKQLAEKSGASQQMISKLETGKAKETSDIVALARACGIRPDWLQDGSLPKYDRKRMDNQVIESGPEVGRQRKAPVVGTAIMGDDGYFEEIDYPVGFGDGYVLANTSDENAYSLRVRGDSMEPAIRDGWYVVCEPNSEPCVGEYVMVKTKSGRSMVKLLEYASRDKVILKSVNNQYPDLTLMAEEIDKMHFVGLIAGPSKHRF